MSACRSCGARIIWAKTKTGKAMPVDAAPNEMGNIELRAGVAHYVASDLNATEQRFTSHFATCPNAADHRSPRRS